MGSWKSLLCLLRFPLLLKSLRQVSQKCADLGFVGKSVNCGVMIVVDEGIVTPEDPAADAGFLPRFLGVGVTVTGVAVAIVVPAAAEEEAVAADTTAVGDVNGGAGVLDGMAIGWVKNCPSAGMATPLSSLMIV